MEDQGYVYLRTTRRDNQMICFGLSGPKTIPDYISSLVLEVTKFIFNRIIKIRTESSISVLSFYKVYVYCGSYDDYITQMI